MDDTILPFINDTPENIQEILELCREAKVYGVICYGIGLTLREGNKEYFYRQLDRLFRKSKNNIFAYMETDMKLKTLTAKG